MMRFMKLFVALFTILLLWSGNSFAVGLGGFVDVSGGSGEGEWESDTQSWDLDSRSGAVGFVLDTAPGDESTFNYRLNVGLVRQDLEDEANVTVESTGIYAENIFGFAFVKNKEFRWWAGPLVRIGFYSGDTGTVQAGPGSSYETEIDYAEFGLGAVTGLNFKVGKAVLSPSIGFRFSGYAGEGETTTTDFLGTYSEKEDIEMNTTTVFVNFAVLF